MDEAEQLIEVFRARARSSVASKLDALTDLEGLGDPRIVPLLLDVLADRREPIQVRIHVLKWLRNGYFIPAYRAPVAGAILHIISDDSSPDLRLQAALAVAEFSDIDGVLTALGGLASNMDEPIDILYSAFTSLQRAGPITGCVALVRQLSTDEALGRSARRLLSLWRVE
jgi:HEAT repeat protein